MPIAEDIQDVGSDAIDRVTGLSETLRALIREGPGVCIDNAPVEMRALVFDGLAVPIVICGSRRGRRDVRADVCSPSAHYADYTGFEMTRQSAAWARPWVAAAAGLFGAALMACRLDQVVYVDNWLLATNPVTPLSEAQVRRVTRFLQSRYPRHAIVHRSVNPLLNAARRDALRAAGYRFVRSRTVYVMPKPGSARERRSNLAIDRSLLSRSALRLVSDEAPAPGDVPTLVSLYRGLYLDKHSRLNPALNARYFAILIRDPFFRWLMLRDAAGLRGFMVTCVSEGHMVGSILGYDLNAPRKLGLYRQLMAAAMGAAERAGLAINLSGGSGEFKRLRGAIACEEYDAVFADHLPGWRRLGWWLVGVQARMAQARRGPG